VNILQLLLLLCGFIYSALPYSVLYLYTIRRGRNSGLSGEEFLKALVWGMTGFILVALPVASFSLEVYRIAHCIMCVPAIIWLAAYARRSPSIDAPLDSAPALIAVAAFIARLSPFLPHSHWWGGGDMRFHNILAKLITVNHSLPDTWLPFADIPVNYPLGSHLLAAFIASHTSIPVHAVLNVLLCLCGALSTALIYALARRMFRDRSAASISAIAYGLTALSGSLDYIRWGGLPNAMAMLLLLLFVLETYRQPGSAPESSSPSLAPALIAAAVVLTHHYSILAMFLLAASLIILTPLKSTARQGLVCASAGLILALLVLRAGNRLPGSGIGHTSVFVFYAHPIGLTEAITSMNIPFAALGIMGLYIILRRDIPASLSIITAWTAAYFAAFVFLEYGYRLAVFSLTKGEHFFTALTPSRLIADLAYPLSLASGAVVTHRSFDTYRPHFLAILSAVGLASCALFFLSLQGATPIAGTSQAIDWISANVPEDSIVVGALPHLEYRSWKRTSAPPIPASEERNSPDLVRQRSMRSVEEWTDYAAARNLKCYFILSADRSSVPPGMHALFSHGSISICVAEHSQ